MALYTPRKNGTCLIDHCEIIADQTGEWPEENPLPEVPEVALELWEWFWSLRRSAGSGMNGPEPIRHSEIAAWQNFHRVEILPQHIRLIEMMDARYIKSILDIQK